MFSFIVVMISIVTYAQEPFSMVIEGYTLEQGDSLKDVILDLKNQVNGLQFANDSLTEANVENCDSLDYYIKLADNWEKSYHEISPYHVDGYDVKVNYNDANGVKYEFTQKDGKSWTRINMDDKSINFWQFGNKVEFWYGHTDSVWVYDDPRYPDKDSVYVEVSQAHMVNQYNINWFNDCD